MLQTLSFYYGTAPPLRCLGLGPEILSKLTSWMDAIISAEVRLQF